MLHSSATTDATPAKWVGRRAPARPALAPPTDQVARTPARPTGTMRTRYGLKNGGAHASRNARRAEPARVAGGLATRRLSVAATSHSQSPNTWV